MVLSNDVAVGLNVGCFGAIKCDVLSVEWAYTSLLALWANVVRKLELVLRYQAVAVPIGWIGRQRVVYAVVAMPINRIEE